MDTFQVEMTLVLKTKYPSDRISVKEYLHPAFLLKRNFERLQVLFLKSNMDELKRYDILRTMQKKDIAACTLFDVWMRITTISVQNIHLLQSSRIFV